MQEEKLQYEAYYYVLLFIYQQEDRCLEFHVEQIIISSGCAKLIIDLKSQSSSSSLDAVFCTFNQILGRGLQKVKPVTKTDLICSFDFLKRPYLSRFFLGKLIHIMYCIIAGQNSIEIRWGFFMLTKKWIFRKLFQEQKQNKKFWKSLLLRILYFLSVFKICFDHCAKGY